MRGLRMAFWIASMILCPAQCLFIVCIDCEVIGIGGFIMYSIIGILNAALYAAIGAAFFRPEEEGLSFPLRIDSLLPDETGARF